MSCSKVNIFNCARFGIYPLTCFEIPPHPIPPRQQASTPEIIDSVKSASPEPLDLENRRVVNMMCNVKIREEGSGLVVSTSDQNFIVFWEGLDF